MTHDHRTYRVGRHLGRTIYRNNQLIGLMDTPEDGQLVVDTLNQVEAAEIEEQWGLTWPPTGDIDWIGTEAEARAVALQPQPPELAALIDLGRLRRRWVLTTKPEPTAGATP